MKKIIKKIHEFRNLEEGWDYGQGIPTTLGVYINSVGLCSLSKHIGFTEDNIELSPNTDGGIYFSFHLGIDEFLDVSVNPNYTYDIHREKGIGTEYNRFDENYNVSMDVVLEKLKNFYTKFSK